MNVAIAFGAGILSFLSPCVLPLVPAFLVNIAGEAALSGRARARTVVHALAFVLGFSAVFTLLCLVTGSLWGKPMWGAFWVWDPRLTSVLILFFLYLGLIALRSSIEDEALAAKLTAVLALVGIVMLPVIKFSVEWNSLHQPASVMRLGAPTIHASLLWPLLVMALGMTMLFAALYLKAMRNEVLRRRVKALRTVAVEGAGGLAGQPAT